MVHSASAERTGRGGATDTGFLANSFTSDALGISTVNGVLQVVGRVSGVN